MVPIYSDSGGLGQCDRVRCSQPRDSYFCTYPVIETPASRYVDPALQSRAGNQPIRRTVDVEDLANLYAPGAQQQPRNVVNQRRHYYQPPSSRQQQQRQQQQQQQQQQNFAEQAAFAYCTDSRWLSCPATSYCPLYDESRNHAIESWHALPCGEQLRGYYTVDDESLDEYLSNEKRKEKSRDAARCRRSREQDIFTELAAVLPVTACEAAHLDKASVMRLVIAYLKTRTLMDAVPKLLAKFETMPQVDELFLKALDGFVLVLDANGDMAYISPNVKDYLGIAQMDLMGQSVFDYSHPCDHDEIRESLSLKISESSEDHQPCNMFLRLKCTLTSKGRKVNLKSASYKVIHCRGRLISHPSTIASITSSNIEDSSNSDNSISSDEIEKFKECNEKRSSVSLVVVASPVPHPSNIEIPLGKSTFLSKHNLSMKFTYADDKLAEFLGWESSDLMGQSVFEFHHALDNLSLDKSYKSLFNKGQCETMAYRFLNKKGGYAWVVTQATLIYCARLQKPLSVVCVNYMLSGVEHEDEICSVRQLEARRCVSVLKTENKAQVSKREENEREELIDEVKASITNLSVIVDDDKQDDNDDDRIDFVLASKKLTNVVTDVDVVDVESGGFARDNDDKENEIVDDVELQSRANLQRQLTKKSSTSDDYRSSRARFSSSTNNTPTTTASFYQPPLNRCTTQTATASIFAPRTEDMNTGFLMFCDDQTGFTMLKDEPDDLTHLAPTPGDVCVPLDPPFLTDMFDEFILGNNYCTLLSPEQLSSNDLSSPISQRQDTTTNCSSSSHDPIQDFITTTRSPSSSSTTSSTSLKHDVVDCCSNESSDPFIYRDSSSRCSLGTDLQSPESSKSPESNGGDGGGGGNDSLMASPYYNNNNTRHDKSLNSKSSVTIGTNQLTDDDNLLTMNFNDMMYDEELEMRAPYIPMCDQDETLQMLMFDDMVMWGPSSSSSSQKKSKIGLADIADDNSSLAQLLTNEPKLIKDHESLIVNPVQVLGQIGMRNNPTQDIITAEREHTNKRVHSYSTKSGIGNKRVKHADLDNNVRFNNVLHNGNNNTTTTTTTTNRRSKIINNDNISSLEKMLSDPMSSSQLLHQLVSQQITQPAKMRNWQDQQVTTNESRNRIHASDNSSNSGSIGDGGGGCGRGNNNNNSSCTSRNHSNNIYGESNSRRLDDKGDGGNLANNGCGGLNVNGNTNQRASRHYKDATTNSRRFNDDDGVDVKNVRCINDNSTACNRQQSNSVLMNLLVSGCDVSAGYVCLTKQNPRSSKGLQASK